jgi:hypothetical protein
MAFGLRGFNGDGSKSYSRKCSTTLLNVGLTMANASLYVWPWVIVSRTGTSASQNFPSWFTFPRNRMLNSFLWRVGESLEQVFRESPHSGKSLPHVFHQSRHHAASRVAKTFIQADGGVL